MKKCVLPCVFVALMCFIGCKNGGKNDNKPEPAKVYQIGDKGPGGGIVFYVSKDGFDVYDGAGGKTVCHYLEMSEKNLGESTWFITSSGEFDHIQTEVGLGYGKGNTHAILEAGKSLSLTEENCAAFRCFKYTTESTKEGDWWLPSKDELDLIHKSQKDVVLAGCTDPWQYSSTEVIMEEEENNHNFAWAHHFKKSFQSDIIKSETASVRAVRAF